MHTRRSPGRIGAIRYPRLVPEKPMMPEIPSLEVETVEIKNVLTRAGGYLETVASHSLQPYRGCPLGRSLCGVGCYVQHARHLTRGREWGSFLDVREGAARSYRDVVARERRWARRARGRFGIFLSSATEPFPPQERRLGTTRAVLDAMLDEPPDALVVQSHLPAIAADAQRERWAALREILDLRCHLSIETDRDRLPGLPPPGSSVDARFRAAATLRRDGVFTVVTVSPLLPIRDPEAFFDRVADTADAVVLDHFVGGDGTQTGSRTRRTALPAAMEAVEPGSSDLAYRDRMVEIARRRVERVGVSIDGFAGRWL